jgi:serine palmitoyltransferase
MSIILGDPVIDSPLSRGVISDTAERGEGEDRLRRLAFNARYLRMGLKRLGFMVYGHDDSPIVPSVSSTSISILSY